jgi:hypothetical protein
MPAHVVAQSGPLAADDQSQIAGEIRAVEIVGRLFTGQPVHPDAGLLELLDAAGEVGHLT